MPEEWLILPDSWVGKNRKNVVWTHKFTMRVKTICSPLCGFPPIVLIKIRSSNWFIYYRCDGEDDCGDGSDEDIHSVCKDIKCTKDQFRCDNVKCINHVFVCDGERDCLDGADESPNECEAKFCPEITSFLCKVSWLISRWYIEFVWWF